MPQKGHLGIVVVSWVRDPHGDLCVTTQRAALGSFLPAEGFMGEKPLPGQERGLFFCQLVFSMARIKVSQTRSKKTAPSISAPVPGRDRIMAGRFRIRARPQRSVGWGGNLTRRCAAKPHVQVSIVWTPERFHEKVPEDSGGVGTFRAEESRWE